MKRIAVFLALCGLVLAPFVQASTKPVNFVYIFVDDLRPELPSYGVNYVIAPNIERLAHGGVVFERAYSNVAVCGASRASLMTGLRPTATRFTRYFSRADKDAPGVTTLPGYLKENGYYTASVGKVMHHQDDSPSAWSEQPWHPKHSPDAVTGTNDYQVPKDIKLWVDDGIRTPVESPEISDDAYFDGKIAIRAIETLKKLKDKNQPFFLGVGFLKPHLPFNAPKKYWDLYDRESFDLEHTPGFPMDAPKQAWHPSPEMRHYAGIPPAPAEVPEEMARTLVHGYHAALSYSDAQIGRVLDALDRLGLSENTVVMLSGDHGWSLGEHTLWNKHSTFNVAAQTPLIIRGPGIEKGARVSSLTEFVDLYPTVVELAGLPEPKHLQGRSLAASLHGQEVSAKPAIFHRYGEADAVRTDRFSYSAWLDEELGIRAEMLYDLKSDPNETVNGASDPQYRKDRDRLRKMLVDKVKEVKAQTL